MSVRNYYIVKSISSDQLHISTMLIWSNNQSNSSNQLHI